MKCRHCRSVLSVCFLDLGLAPPSNAYLTKEQVAQPDNLLPLRLFVCTDCWLVQTEDFAGRDILFADDYAYFSSFSTSWLAHARRYVDDMVERFDLSQDSMIVEVASNDGYLLQFVRERGIRCLGIEPTASTASAARAKGIEVRELFFGTAQADALVTDGLRADLTVANNVLAHVPDINDFAAGFTRLLQPHGVGTFEFPHLMRLVEHCQFDTVYHEHFSYLSLTAVLTLFETVGLDVFDVEELATHGGSLRVFAQRADVRHHLRNSRVNQLLAREHQIGMRTRGYYQDFQQRANRVRDDFRTFLEQANRAGKRVMAYGAAAKGNTLMNYAGVNCSLIKCVVDRNPAKQGKFMPGSRIPIVDESAIDLERPDYVVIFPWNLGEEIAEQLASIYKWGGRFVTAVPSLTIF